MNVRRVKARLTTIGPGPFRFGSDKTHTSSVALVMDLPLRGEDHLDVFFGEEIGRDVRAHKNTDGPVVCQLWRMARCQHGGNIRSYILLSDMKNVACA